MGGSIGWNLGTLLRLKDHDRRTATISGMAAFFSALFGTPLAAEMCIRDSTMIGRFIDQTLDESKMPLTLTSYSPCFRKEKRANGIEERGIYRIH